MSNIIRFAENGDDSQILSDEVPRTHPLFSTTSTMCLKWILERISGYSLEKVTIEVNSDRPARIGCVAYAKGFLAKDDRTKSTHGQRVVAMIINGLGFCTSPLYLSEQFFIDTPVDILIGKNLKASHFNDDALGRTLDALSKFGTTKLFCQIAFDLVKLLNLLGPTLHLDTTSLALFGEYDVDECKNTPKPTYGH